MNIKAPWVNDEKARLVKSSSSPQPHLVTRHPKNVYICDKECPIFKAISMCAHVVATAEVNNDLTVF